MAKAAALTRWWREVTGSPEVHELEIPASADTRSAATCAVGERAEVVGRLRVVALQPCDSLCALIAELYDGTDAIDLIWLGRRSIAGIDAGRMMRASGRIALRDGRKTIYNPIYQLLPSSP